MRAREKIEKDGEEINVNNTVASQYRDRAILEVLLDIRDLLNKTTKE